jgi:Tfp pilus assembly protein PilF
LHSGGDLDQAIAENREAIRLKKDFAEANCNLGRFLQEKGQFTEALSYFRRCHELGSKDPHWPYPSERWVKECERLIELDAQLTKILNGEAEPSDAPERLVFADMCLRHKSLYGASVRFFSQAFAEKPPLADDLQMQYRYNAVCAAALAGCRQGKDADNLDEKERGLRAGPAISGRKCRSQAARTSSLKLQ